MREPDNAQLKLQQLLDCYLDTDPAGVLRAWADSGWPGAAGASSDETCLKYIALVLLDSIANRARTTILEMGCPALVDAGAEQHMLPPAPASLLARGLELLREMCGLEGGPGAKGCCAWVSETTASSCGCRKARPFILFISPAGKPARFIVLSTVPYERKKNSIF
jgi:hypothetical protein